MKRIYDLLYLLNKIHFYTYLESDDDEKFTYIRKLLIDKFEDFNSVKIKNMLNVVDGLVNYFDNIDSWPFGYW